MMSKKIATLTCSEINADTTVDDDLCWEILRDSGIIVDEVIWDQEHDYSQYELVLIRTTWDYMYKAQLFKKKLTEISTQSRLINPLETVLWNMNKKYLVEFEQKGLPVIPSFFGEHFSSDEIENFLSKPSFNQGLIIKPCIGGSSHGIQLVKNREDYQAVDNGEWLVQPYLPGISEIGETSMIYFNGKFSHAICKKPKSGEFRCQEEYGSTITAVEPTKAMYDVAHQVLDSLTSTLPYARVDLIPFEKSYRLVELELIEPCLFLHYEPEKAPSNMATMIQELLRLKT